MAGRVAAGGSPRYHPPPLHAASLLRCVPTRQGCGIHRLTPEPHSSSCSVVDHSGDQRGARTHTHTHAVSRRKSPGKHTGVNQSHSGWCRCSPPRECTVSCASRGVRVTRPSRWSALPLGASLIFCTEGNRRPGATGEARADRGTSGEPSYSVCCARLSRKKKKTTKTRATFTRAFASTKRLTC